MYRAGNANLTTYGAGPRVWLLALAGKLLGIQFHIQGLPFGASHCRVPLDSSIRVSAEGKILG